MSEFIKPYAKYCAAGVEAVGITLIVLLTAMAVLSAFFELFQRRELSQIYDRTRERLARGILMGLEFLLAADIIHTVAVDLSFETVGVLAIIVAIRTFLSFALEVEINGRWPWQQPKAVKRMEKT